MALAGTVLLIVFSALSRLDSSHIVSFSLYGISLLLLYTTSTLYHSLRVQVAARLFLRKLDHAMIYLFIAGSYAPPCFICLRGRVGWTLFGIISLLAVCGVLLSFFWIGMPRALTASLYIAMGWTALFALVPLFRAMSVCELLLLFSGGFLYTTGGILYAIKWPCRSNPRFGCHEIFHLFILAGSAFHLWMMFLMVF